MLQLAELQQLAFYLDSDISPWQIDKPWDDLLPSEWAQVYAAFSFIYKFFSLD